MSGTDSENDYESADDDEVIKDKSIPHDEATPENSESKPDETYISKPSDVLHNDVPRQNKGAEEKAFTSIEHTPKTCEDISSVSCNSDSNNQVHTVTELKDSSVDNDSSKDLENSNSESSLKNTGSLESQSKRVTLRLEKKIQQKNQAVSKADSVEEPPPQTQEKSSWGFGSWGSSILSTAASSVSSFTRQVTQGIETVLETVESSLGAPPPEDLAAILRERKDSENSTEKKAQETINIQETDKSSLSAYSSDVASSKEKENSVNSAEKTEKSTEVEDNVLSNKEENKEEDNEDIPVSSNIFKGVSSLKNVIEITGSKLLTGGIDTLEMIGKMTMDALTEGDPGLRKKRSVLSQGINLSEILREAKDKAEQEQANSSLENPEDNVHFTTFFDEFQGLVHLEALEMLSSQCQTKVQNALLMQNLENHDKEQLEHIKRICEDLPSADDTPDDKTQEFEACLDEHLKDLQLPVDLSKIKEARKVMGSWLDTCIAEQESEKKDAKEVYKYAIRSLAEFTARSVEQFHKFGELILVNTDPDFNVLISATHLAGLTSVLRLEVSIIAMKFCDVLNTFEDSECQNSLTQLITNVFLEASNSNTYIQDAFHLLVPVLQMILLQ